MGSMHPPKQGSEVENFIRFAAGRGGQPDAQNDPRCEPASLGIERTVIDSCSSNYTLFHLARVSPGEETSVESSCIRTI